MLLKPFDRDEPSALPVEVSELIEASKDAELVTSEMELKDRARLTNARNIFNKKGASLEAAAQNISNIMERGETDNARLNAAKLVLQVQGILNDVDERSMPVFNINIVGNDNKTLVNLVLPT